MPAGLASSLLGLASAATWGAGDFCGGLSAKRSPLLGVVIVNYAFGAALLAAIALLSGEPAPGATALGFSAAAGLAGLAGLASLYRGLAVGRMAVVAPVSAVLSAAIPAAFSTLSEGVPAAAKLAGMALGLAGIWLVSRGEGPADRTGLLLGLLAGAGIGAFLLLMHLGTAGAPFWPLAAARAASFAVALPATLLGRRPGLPAPARLPLVLLSGALDAAGNALFVLAGRAGRLDVAAILSSMYPASTIVLSAALLRERVSRPQAIGIGAMLGAIALIAG